MQFHFKRFSVKNSDSAMKVGTDGVLLGTWMSLMPSDSEILDIGTGTGVIALIAAQRYADSRQNNTLPNITAIDIDKPSALEAMYNFEHSPWSDFLTAENIALQEFAKNNEHRFDLIFSNPPYFIDSLKAPEERRTTARHCDSLSHSDIIEAAQCLLKPFGRLALILPSEEAESFMRRASLSLTRLCQVRTSESKPPKRYLMEFVSDHAKPITKAVPDCLTIQNGPDFTEQYKALTRDFYLKF